MKSGLLWPAFSLLKRMSFGAGFTLVGAAFVLPAFAAFLLLPLAALPGQAMAILVALSLLAFYFLAALYAHMTFGVSRLIRVADRVAAGELVNSKAMVDDASRNNDSDRLWSAIMKMNGSLVDIVQQVRSSAEVIVGASRDIADGHKHLSHRTEEQAVSVEETAAGMEELAASARRNAENCVRATGLASSAKEVAGTAAGQMEELARTMQQIDARVQQVGDILGAVEGIAFQTNILALNAAVEAARAGEEGRGFAVVASEVRSLAQRSAQAAKEIKVLLGHSRGSVEEGKHLVEAAGATMQQVVGSASQVGEVIEQIAAASSEQSAGVAEINRAITQIDATTQENAALVEQATSAALSFERESARMLEVVGRFKTDRTEDRAHVIERVKAAAEHLRKVGPERACADFNDRQGRFVQGEYYVFALGMNGVRLAYAPDPSVVGQNNIDAGDADGKPFGRELIRIASASGAGWCDFKFLNPKSGRIEPKSVYIERVGEVILGCGIYKADGGAAGRPQEPARGAARLGLAPGFAASR